MNEDQLKHENDLLRKIVSLREQIDDLEARLHKESWRAVSFRQLVEDMIHNGLARQHPGSDFARGEWYVYARWLDKARLWLRKYKDEDEAFMKIYNDVEEEQKRYDFAAAEWNRIQALPKKERDKIMRRGIA